MISIFNIVPITLVISLICCLKYASSILCYDCNSAYDPRCGEEFDSFSLGIVNCSLRDPLEHIAPIEPTLCRTIKMEIYGKVRVVRQCGYIPDEEQSEKSCHRQASTGDLFVTYCSCDTDLCNSASSMDTQKMAVYTSILLLTVHTF
ncbi:uncharacterized protein LOC116413066 [Galleria mellonella]|uniref:Uncharacterized protein LOC116413066 n=1 Tax=Galleria mellonella TaxID=7137 RepID=A0A6J3C483_GALME|nr:uncharacterized protein LOC116413066 [Galleria mellonella]